MSWLKKLLPNQEPKRQPPETIMIALDEAQGAYRGVLLQLLADLRQKFGEAFPEIQIKLDRDDIPDVYRLVRVDAFYKSGDKVGAGEANIKDPWLSRR